MALEFQEEVLFEDVFEPQCGGQGFVRLAGNGQLWQLACKAAGQRDDTAGVLRQQVFVHPRLVVKAVQVGTRY